MNASPILNHPKDLKKLIKILTNITKHPNEQKYRTLNVARVKKLFINYHQCLPLLFHVGFQISNDHKRLCCDQPNLNDINSLKQKLRSTLYGTSNTKIQSNFHGLFAKTGHTYIHV